MDMTAWEMFGIDAPLGSETADTDWLSYLKAGSAYVPGLVGAYSKYQNASAGASGGSSSSFNSGISEAGEAARQNAYNILSSVLGDSAYSKENAIKDSQGQIKAIFDQYAKSDLPKIYQAGVTSGGYNSPTQQMLANDAFAQATAKGQASMADNIMRYAQARQAQLSPLISLLSSDRGTASSNTVGSTKPGDKTQASYDLLANLLGLTAGTLTTPKVDKAAKNA